MALASCAFGAEPAGVGISVSASSGIPAGLKKDEWVGPDSEEFPKLAYAGQSKEGKLLLTPTLLLSRDGKKKTDLLEPYRSGKEIYPFGCSTEMNLSFPALDVKLVNNGKQAIHFTSAVLKVAKSSPDPTPLPMVLGGYDQVQGFDVVNEGWDMIDTLRLDFTFTPDVPKGPPPESLPYQRTFQRVKEQLRVDLTDELGKAGVAPELTAAAKSYLAAKAAVTAMELKSDDLQKLETEPAYMKAQEDEMKISERMSALDPKLAGPFRKACFIHGRMTLTWKDGGEVKTRTFPFHSDILMFPPDGLGAPGPVAGKYEAMLRESGENYELPIDVSRIVKAGGVDRFVVTLGLPRTSKHELTLELHTTEGETLSTGPVAIEGLLPRTAADMLTEGASEDP